MFEDYIEKELQRRIKIIDILWKMDNLTSIEIAEELSVTAATVKSDIKLINIEYCDKSNPLIVSSSVGYSVLNKPNRNKKEYLKKIYGASLFVKATCFFLKSSFCDIEKLEEVEYISQSKAYSIKKKVSEYLEELEIMENGKFVEHSERRVRFLLAFFQFELGVEVVNISEENRAIYQIFFNEVEAIEKCMFSEYSKNYAMILFQISFVRKNQNPVTFTTKELELIRETLIYKRLSSIINLFLQKMLRFNILEEEAIYFALVVNVMNANYYDQSETYRAYVKLIQESALLKYQSLVMSFESGFKSRLRDNLIFESALISFLRKCILNLQTLIPEEHISLGKIVQVPENIIEKIKMILNDWNSQTNLNLKFSNAHIMQLASKLFFILRKIKRPKRIYLLTSFYTDYLLAKELLVHEYGAIVDIRRFNPNMQSDFHDDDLILYDVDYDVLKKFSSMKLKINFIFDVKELQEIRKLLFGYDLEGIEENKNGSIRSI